MQLAAGSCTIEIVEGAPLFVCDSSWKLHQVLEARLASFCDPVVPDVMQEIQALIRHPLSLQRACQPMQASQEVCFGVDT